MKKWIVILFLLIVSLCYAEKPKYWNEPNYIKLILTQEGEKANLPRGLSHCLSFRESEFSPTALSRVVNGYRSCGITQLYRKYMYGPNGSVARFSSHPSTFNWKDPRDNAEVGCGYLAYLIDDFGGSVYLGLIAYNWGETALRNIRSMDEIPIESINYANDICKYLDEWNESW